MTLSCMQTEGIVLEAVPFQDYDRILTLFTPQGLLKLFVRMKKRDLLLQNMLTSPLVRGEYLYIQGRGELMQLKDGSLLAHHMKLRNSFEHFETAQKMAHLIARTQWPGKPAPALYSLFLSFLEKIPEGNDLLSVFILKLLKHEGVLQLQRECALCHAPLESTFRSKGEIYCPQHAPPLALEFTHAEEMEMTTLSQSRLWKEILAAKNLTWKKKLEKLAHEVLNLE